MKKHIPSLSWNNSIHDLLAGYNKLFVQLSITKNGVMEKEQH